MIKDSTKRKLLNHQITTIMKKNLLILILNSSFIIFHSSLQAQNVSIGHTSPIAKLDIRGIASIPSIPGGSTPSTPILRIGISSNASIDFGKMDAPPYIGWIQAGHTDATGPVASPLSLQPLGGNVGIGTGTSAPLAKLEVAGQIKITGGSPGDGKVLTSNATGLASWQPPPPPPGTNDPSVSICCQRWMTKNLDVTTYRNGDAIPKVTNNAEWAALTTGAYCYYNNDSTTYAVTYGKLYNWYAVNDPRGLAPEGWYIPTDFEWTTLANCLGGDDVAGGPLKEIGTTHWITPNTGATNLSGFSGLPGGVRASYGPFASIGNNGIFWSSTEFNTGNAWYHNLNYLNDDLFGAVDSKNNGFSIRCLRD